MGNSDVDIQRQMCALTRIGPSPSRMDLPAEAETRNNRSGPSATAAILGLRASPLVRNL
jgi:hypothetical protein